MQNNLLTNELARCLGCKTKPCEKACPIGVSPHDFIALSKDGDFTTAAAEIAKKNPLPQTCGLICPNVFCQKACIRGKIDTPIEIPCLQAEIMKRGGYPAFNLPEDNGKKAAVIGGGAGGLGALYEFLLSGWSVDIYDKSSVLGGAARLIPEYRLPKEVLDFEITRLTSNNRVNVYLNQEITDFELLKEKYDSIILALGETNFHSLNIKGEEFSIPYAKYLSNPPRYQGKKIAVTGGGEVALDCAITAKRTGAECVEMFVRRRREDMRISPQSQQELEKYGVIIRELSSITEITQDETVLSFNVIKNRINEQKKAEALPNTNEILTGYDMLIQALGAYYPKEHIPEGYMIAGDMTGQGGMIVQALASGRLAARKIINGEAK